MVALAAALAVGVVAAGVAAVTVPGRVGPQLRLLQSGRALTPQGKLVTLGNFPTGGALTRDGHFYWTISTGRGRNDIRIVNLHTARVVQTVRLPGASGGIAMDPSSNTAYVSGLPDSDHKDEAVPNAPGRQGDVVHVFTYASTGKATFKGLIGVPPPSDAPTPQDFPPTNLAKMSWPDRLAVSRDGKRLLVPLNLADAAAVVDVASKAVRYVKTGNYPYGAAILRDGKTGLVSNETPGTVSVVDLDSATKVKDIQVGSHLSHPEAIAVDPKADRAYVAVTNADQVAVIDTKKLTVERTLSVARPEGDGTAPVDVSVTPDGVFLLVAESGADELAVFKLPGAGAGARSRLERRAAAVLAHEARVAAAHDPASRRKVEEDEAEGELEAGVARAAPVPAAFSLVGRIPVASYPADVEAAPAAANTCFPTAKPKPKRKPARKSARVRRKRCSKLVWVSGKGLGVGPNPKGPNPYVINDDNANSQNYLPTLVTGKGGVLDFPTVARIRAVTPAASRQIRPSNPQKAPAGTPLRPNGPIKHVFYIVRENRTYDQVLGDDRRGDGDPGLAIFGRQVTPNMHALVERFPLLDHVYANSEASIDGHFWTSAAKVSDYVHKNWNQNYAGRKRPYDFGVYAVTWPSKGFLFDQAERQGISYFNFGEAVAGDVPIFPDKDRTQEDLNASTAKFNKSDLGRPVPGSCYTNDAFIFSNTLSQSPVSDSTPPPGSPPNTESRYDCFAQKFRAQLATNSVPAFTYIVLPQDHTEGGTAGRNTPRAWVANNDYALGQMIDLISHSSVWDSSATIVLEDDSQDGPDHVDAHRIPAAIISPFAKSGAVVHTRYDFLSMIRSMELILGMRPLGLFDNLATPMYDAFTSTPANSEPYTVIQPTWDRTEKNKAGTAAARLSRGVNLNYPDQIRQRLLDRIIWKTVYGDRAEPPPPGPNANAGE
jgi:DNA-binding beta-propeller fold protein YncE/phospholipase C